MTGNNDWMCLREALDKLADDGRQVQFWWRDDDAVSATGQLDRLIDVANRFDAPLLLAAIPQFVDDTLVERVSGESRVRIGVHGFAHINHASKGQKKQELGDHRPLANVVEDLEIGRKRLRDRFGEAFVDVLVPPWNRISKTVQSELVKIGFRGLSCFGSEEQYAGLPGLSVANTHIDPIDWHGSRSLCDPRNLIETMAKLVIESSHNSEGRVCGLLTHHLIHDVPLWQFIEGFCETLEASPNATWRDPAVLFQ